MTSSQTEPARSRGNPSLGDMVRSIVLIGLLVGGVVALTNFLRDEPEGPTSPTDYRTVAEQVGEAVRFDPLIPGELRDGWWSNDARLSTERPRTWHLGMVTAADDYIGLEQSTAPVHRMVERFAEGTKADGSVTITGARWDVRTGGSETVFVRRAAGASVLVTGDAPRGEMERYIEVLEPV